MAYPVCSEEVRRYFAALEAGADDCYRTAAQARRKGFDPSLEVEIPKTQDLASRVEQLLSEWNVEGVARRIRELSATHDREETAILVAKEVARRPAKTKEEAIDRAVRVGLAILTEGILVAPLEGLADVRIKRNADGSNYVDLAYAGPIRSAGGTGQALSVLIADVVRRDLGVGRYVPTRPEVERFKEEIPLYKQVQHLQYAPSDEEIALIAGNCPVAINGEGTEDVEISGHRDLPRLETNRLRGGACLVVADGLCLKAPKIQKHVRRLRIDGWEFIDTYLEAKGGTVGNQGDGAILEPSETFIENILAGRPVLCYPSRAGGPATMVVLDDFIAVGTQIKTERPGKAGAVSPCESIEGPLVLLESGDFVAVASEAEARELRPKIKRIIDLGEVLVPYGEFLENNHPLVPGAFAIEWYREELRAAAGELPADWESPSWDRALALSREHRVPLHPRFNLFWHDLDVPALTAFREVVLRSGKARGDLLLLPFDAGTQDVLVTLGATHRLRGGELVVEAYARALLAGLGIEATSDGLRARPAVEASNGLEFASRNTGVPVKARGPTRIGARMGRPEKAAPREMSPPPHGLFPLGAAGGMQRLVNEAVTKEAVEIEIGLRVCSACGQRWLLPRCPKCGAHTEPRMRPMRQKIPLREILDDAMARIGMTSMPPGVKGVQGMISRSKTPEPMEKGLLRAKHGLHVFKDGTTRFDMTNLVLTHFRPEEIRLSIDRARALGYERDVHGAPLADPMQLVELRPQDVVIPVDAGDFLVKVAQFVDELLARMYGLPPFYNVSSREALIGHLVVTLAPHTSGGVLGRVIGFTKARAWFNHPYMVAARRRNADGDEDSVLLLLDCLVNFSRAFLPEKRGGLMDAPLVLTTRIDPNEIDKEAHNLDLNARYPLEFYRATERFAHPREVESVMDLASRRIGTVLQYEGFGSTHSVESIEAGPLMSAYVKGSMEEKMEAQLALALKIRAVDTNDVVARIVVHHFLPDLIGNLKRFSLQMFRCTKCSAKYRRMPLKGKCTAIAGKHECGGDLTLTVHEGSVKKYLEVTKRITREYPVSPYLQQRIALIEDAISSLFTNDKAQDLKLDDFL
ncbi:MAG: DNA polymerase II large subunit [Methanobacteriota archaeon]|nr:MAG: DNA polymerase II large subunit [Euryarchaeota archaeon]